MDKVDWEMRSKRFKWAAVGEGEGPEEKGDDKLVGVQQIIHLTHTQKIQRESFFGRRAARGNFFMILQPREEYIQI
jgi:hypothetical protein